MTYNVDIKNISAVDALDVKHQLVNVYELVDGQDFTWAWFPEVLDEHSYFVTRPKQLEVRFVDQSSATFFQLKFGK
jgi:hypothetical protein